MESSFDKNFVDKIQSKENLKKVKLLKFLF